MAFAGTPASLAAFALAFAGTPASLAAFALAFAGTPASLAAFALAFAGTPASLAAFALAFAGTPASLVANARTFAGVPQERFSPFWRLQDCCKHFQRHFGRYNMLSETLSIRESHSFVELTLWTVSERLPDRASDLFLAPNEARASERQSLFISTIRKRNPLWNTRTIRWTTTVHRRRGIGHAM